VSNYATLLHRGGAHADDERLSRGNLALSRSHYGKLHPSTFLLTNNLALLLRDQGRLSEAEPFYRIALAGRREKLGARAPSSHSAFPGAPPKSVLHPIYPIYPIKSATLLSPAHSDHFYPLPAGATHPETLTSIDGLAGLLRERGKLDEAEPLYRRALAARRKSLGKGHPTTLTSINKLAQVLREQGRLNEAEPLLGEALAARRETLGSRHPETVRSMYACATVLCYCGRSKEAEALFLEALPTSLDAKGAPPKDAIHALATLTVCMSAEGRAVDAEQLSRTALAACRAALGDLSLQTLSLTHSLAELLETSGTRLDEAEALHRVALEGRRATLGMRDPNTLMSVLCLVSLLKTQRRLSEAEPLLREALQASRDILGDRHEDTLEFVGGAKREHRRPSLCLRGAGQCIALLAIPCRAFSSLCAACRFRAQILPFC
jgi:tetratricopeptide (TPR) repeat protein